jgi:hypothetical protein
MDASKSRMGFVKKGQGLSHAKPKEIHGPVGAPIALFSEETRNCDQKIAERSGLYQQRSNTTYNVSPNITHEIPSLADK